MIIHIPHNLVKETNEIYHNSAAVCEVGLDAEDVIVLDLDTSAFRIVQMQIPDLRSDQTNEFKL